MRFASILCLLHLLYHHPALVISLSDNGSGDACTGKLIKITNGGNTSRCDDLKLRKRCAEFSVKLCRRTGEHAVSRYVGDGNRLHAALRKASYEHIKSEVRILLPSGYGNKTVPGIRREDDAPGPLLLPAKHRRGITHGKRTDIHPLSTSRERSQKTLPAPYASAEVDMQRSVRCDLLKNAEIIPAVSSCGIESVMVSTYQAITGTGMRAVTQMENERNGIMDGPMIYPHVIDRNCIPQCDSFTENGYTKEEMKLVNETHKIFGDDSILVSPTAIRVPVVGGHSESINVETVKDFTMEEVRALLEQTPGVKVVDCPERSEYPMAITAQHHDEVFVGRLRRDLSNPKAMNMWVVADNLRKGAATNAVQIAQYLLAKGFIKA